jgi:DNA replication and repair protein RecF
MILTKININQVRNLVEQQLEFTNGVNLILGPNGSGKSSVLESIHLLGYGRSFRSHHTRPLIKFGQPTLVISADIRSDLNDSYRFGYQKTLNGRTSVRLNQEDVTFLEMIRFFPIQIIHPESFEQIYSGAIPRRKILDWGMFHVEPSFGLMWAKYQKVLKQRNSALKHAASNTEITCWDEMLCDLGEHIEAIRRQWVPSLLTEIKASLVQLLPDLSEELVLRYESGWQSDQESMAQALSRSLLRDKHLGTTQVGPHRADLVMLYRELSIERVLSRGQQKLIMMALFMAQARWLKENTGKKSVLLIDDVISELDNTNISKLLAFLREQDQQVLITAVDEKGLDFADKISDLRRFSIENGEVCRVG